MSKHLPLHEFRTKYYLMLTTLMVPSILLKCWKVTFKDYVNPTSRIDQMDTFPTLSHICGIFDSHNTALVRMNYKINGITSNPHLLFMKVTQFFWRFMHQAWKSCCT